VLGPDLGDVVLADPPIAAIALQDERQVHKDLPTRPVAEGDVGEATGRLLADRVGAENRHICPAIVRNGVVIAADSLPAREHPGPEALEEGIRSEQPGQDVRFVRVDAGALFEAEGAEFEVYEGLRDLPAYDEDFDVSDVAAAVARIRATVREADAVLFATPEYNSSIPGVLKNAVDWLSRPSLAESALRGKPFAVVGASIGVFGAVWAQAELRKVLGATGARVIEGEVALGRAMDRFDADGRLSDENLGAEVREVVDEPRARSSSSATATK